ncbi:MAG: discoidin domain-containing protein [Armatimonadetes bacterium]|nr:discoidin domain-containing protein [Armatimonadota bacterium]
MRWALAAALTGLALPSAGAPDLSPAAGSVFVASPAGAWHPASADRFPGGVTIRLDPEPTSFGRLRLLVDPPTQVDIHDRTPPRITGLKVDGKPKAPEAEVALGRGDWQPARIAVGVEDAESPVAEADVVFVVDGRRHGYGEGSVAKQGDTYALDLPDLDLGQHTVVFTAADASPQQNEARLILTWERVLPDNYCLAEAGATLTVDSHFPNYPDVIPLQDGRTRLPGDHCRNDVSWASAESPDPHWVEIDFGQVRRITRVSLGWAYYAGVYHTSQNWEVQLPDGNGWRTVWAAPPNGLEPRPFTTARWGFAVTRKLRIYQPPGGGPQGRPDLLWLAEVMAR